MPTEGHNGYIVETINPDDVEYDDYIDRHFSNIDTDYFNVDVDETPMFLRIQGE